MAYTDKFIPTDNLIAQLSPVVAAVVDPMVSINYSGFLSVSAVTVYELAIKTVFIEFAARKNKVFGVYVENKFEKINGRIKLESLINEFISSFGDRYLNRFKSEINRLEDISVHAGTGSIKTKYNNLIVSRHQFVHGGAPTLTVAEVMDSYNSGKHVIHSLNHAMYR